MNDINKNRYTYLCILEVHIYIHTKKLQTKLLNYICSYIYKYI